MTENQDLVGGDEDTGGFGRVMIALLLLTVIACVGYALWADRENAKELAARAEAPDTVTIGNGGRLTAPGVSLLYGPLNVREHTRFASMPFYVEEHDPKTDVVLSCLVLDEGKRLVAGGGLTVPPKLTGGDLSVGLGRELLGGSVECKLVKP